MYFDVATWGYYAALLIRLRICAALLCTGSRCNRRLRETS